MLIDQVDRMAHAEMVATVTLVAAGAEAEVPTPAQRRAEFDAALCAEAKQYTVEQRDLLEALGVGG